MPMDVVKSRIQNMPKSVDNKPLYDNMVDCAVKSVKQEVGVSRWVFVCANLHCSAGKGDALLARAPYMNHNFMTGCHGVMAWLHTGN